MFGILLHPWRKIVLSPEGNADGVGEEDGKENVTNFMLTTKN
jgi:hypothetical protein